MCWPGGPKPPACVPVLAPQFGAQSRSGSWPRVQCTSLCAGMLVHTPHNLTAFTRAVLAEHDAFFVDPLVGHRALGRLLQTPYPLPSLEFA